MASPEQFAHEVTHAPQTFHALAKDTVTATATPCLLLRLQHSQDPAPTGAEIYLVQPVQVHLLSHSYVTQCQDLGGTNRESDRGMSLPRSV